MFCKQCDAVSPKSKNMALILAIFLGYLGVHRFYVGKIGTGLLYFFTGGLYGVGWILDIIQIVSGNFRDNHGLPLVK
jgi:TM2 domain-containing membrane protein YozV